MYIKEIYISEYKILNDLKIKLQPPPKNKNLVNVIAGINGTGKTSLLEAIAIGFGSTSLPENIQLILDAETKKKLRNNLKNIQLTLDAETEKKRLKNNNLKEIAEDLEKRRGQGPKIIYIASYLIYQFKPVTQLETEYQFINQLDPEEILGNAEYYIREYIIAHERNSYESDPLKRTREAVDEFNQYFQEANLLTKLHDLDRKHFNRPIFKQENHDTLVSIRYLSDGERQLYGLIVAMMILNPVDSIILIDEPELALHPAWQQVIMSIYTKIGQNNQFIVATHSPQIIARTSIKNLILLTNDKNSHKIEAIYPKQLTNGIDINSILSELMGVDSIPKEQLELHHKYRELVEKHQENSPEAQTIKQQILEKESNASEFMQEMQFIIQLREE